MSVAENVAYGLRLRKVAKPEMSERARQALAMVRLEQKGDRLTLMKAEYEKAGPEPSHMRYGYVVPNGTIDHSVFA